MCSAVDISIEKKKNEQMLRTNLQMNVNVNVNVRYHQIPSTRPNRRKMGKHL